MTKAASKVKLAPGNTATLSAAVVGDVNVALVVASAAVVIEQKNATAASRSLRLASLSTANDTSRSATTGGELGPFPVAVVKVRRRLTNDDRFDRAVALRPNSPASVPVNRSVETDWALMKATRSSCAAALFIMFA